MESGLGVRENIDFVFGFEFSGKVVYESIIDVSSTEMSVVSSTFDGKMTLNECNDGSRH